MNTPITRTLLFVVVLMFLLLTPWWITVPILIGLSIYYPLYLEVLFFGFLFDALYSVNYEFPYTGLTSAFVLLMLILFVRTRIRT